MGLETIIYIIIVICVILALALVGVLAYVWIRDKKRQTGNIKTEGQTTNTTSQTKLQGIESMSKFLDFDEIVDSMIVRKNGAQYVMVIQCKGINYDLLGEDEKLAVESGFTQFLNTLRFPVQLYIQTRTVNLESSISTYNERVNEIKNDYFKKQMEYNSLVNSGTSSKELVEKARFEMVKAQNLYEYGIDIIQNTERMNFNKNILKKHYYIIISYIPEDIAKTDYDEEEVKSIAFSELYTKAQAIISSLSVCEINAKVLNSKELIELMYIAYNRDEAEVYELEDAIKAGFDEIYSTAPNVLEKRMKELEKEIERQAMNKANEAVHEAIDNREKAKKLKEKEEKMDELIRVMAKSILEENSEIIGKDTKEEAKKIIDN